MTTLNPEQWQKLSPYLDQALTLADEERARWLADLRAKDAVLAEQVQALLDDHREAKKRGFLETSPALPMQPEVFAGETVGAYRLLSMIGQGGMGMVWLAERSDGRFRRQAAIKFLGMGLVDRGSQERFKREGAILGRLSHPHIAELLDAGVSQTGRPYLVLEFVDGVPIHRYCDQHKLDINARCRLFLDVLSAVSHAHASLIVHRDIKPPNVLVSREGLVKLLDFGIAKLLEGEGSDGSATLLTHEAGSALTPEFAAPEQITGAPVTTATDVYALGVLLYLVLSGQNPAGPGLHSAAGLVKAIVDTEPPRASEVAGRVPLDVSSSAAAERGATPEKLRRQLQGDLDTILAKALKKDPRERYASVTALADDVNRYLNNEPISARPDTLAYRSAKFVRRNRGTVAVTSIALLAVLAGIGGTLLQARSARKQRDLAIFERDSASRVTQFMIKMFNVSDPSESRGNSVTAREILDKAASEIDTQLGKDPETQAQMMDVMGNVYLSLGLLPKSESLLKRSLEIRRQALGPNHPDTLASASDLGRTLEEEDRGQDAEKLLRKTLAAQQHVLGAEHPGTLTCMYRLANALSSESRYSEAEQLDRQVLETRRRVLGPDHTDTVAAMDNLAWLYLVEARLPEAEKMQRDALAIAERVQGADNPDTLGSINRLARILSVEKKFPEAEKVQRDGLDIQVRVIGPDHRFTQRSRYNLLDILASEHKYVEAEKLGRQIQAIEIRLKGPEHPNTAFATYVLGCVVAPQGRKTEALSLLKEALDHGLDSRTALAIVNEDELKGLHGDPRFTALIRRAKERAAAASSK
jgi:eukaryotic-like serine/threonine-protein kinase